MTTAGREARDEALGALEIARAEWLAKARRIAHWLGKDGRIVTCDDVRKLRPIPKEIDGRVMGAVFKKSDWEKVGYTQTAVKTSHARPIAQFRLRGAA